MMPRAAYEAQQAGSQSRMLAPPSQPRRNRVMPGMEEMDARPRKPAISVVPNLAEGLPKRRPPWEGGGEEPAQSPRRTSTNKPASQAHAEPPKQDGKIKPISHMERQGLQVIAKLVHEAVMNADEPDEFVEKVMSQWSPEVLRKLVGDYSPDDVARGIVEVQPNSAGATPEGQKFVKAAFEEIAERI